MKKRHSASEIYGFCGWFADNSSEFIFGLIFFCRSRVVLEAQAQSESIQVKGEAEAFAIEAKAKAEAEKMARKADAWKDYQEAAMVDMVLETLPKVRNKS